MVLYNIGSNNPYTYCVNKNVKRKAISLCNNTGALRCILDNVYGSDTTTTNTITSMSISNNTYIFNLQSDLISGYYHTPINFTINDASYSFDCTLDYNYSKQTKTFVQNNTINVTSTSNYSTPITTSNTIGDNTIYTIYTINSGTYSVSIPGITTESTSITFGDVTTNTSGALSQTITIN